MRKLRLAFVLVSLFVLLAAPAWSQGTFDYASPTQVTGTTSTTITVLVIPVGFKTLDCPSTGMIGKFCAEVADGDTGGFEGDLPSDLQVAEIDQGHALASPDWEIEDGCIDAITTDGDFFILEVDDGSTTHDVYCDTTKGLLGRICPELEVDDCTQFLGEIFPIDHDHPGERELVVIRATE